MYVYMYVERCLLVIESMIILYVCNAGVVFHLWPLQLLNALFGMNAAAGQNSHMYHHSPYLSSLTFELSPPHTYVHVRMYSTFRLVAIAANSYHCINWDLLHVLYLLYFPQFELPPFPLPTSLPHSHHTPAPTGSVGYVAWCPTSSPFTLTFRTLPSCPQKVSRTLSL